MFGSTQQGQSVSELIVQRFIAKSDPEAQRVQGVIDDGLKDSKLERVDRKAQLIAGINDRIARHKASLGENESADDAVLEGYGKCIEEINAM